MKRRFTEVALVSLICFAISSTAGLVAVAASAVGETTQTTVPAKKPDKTDLENLMTRAPSVTSHAITVNGKVFKYTATAGYLTLKDESGKPEAYVFFTAYTRDDVEQGSLRPLTFAFNGGPGAASVWLHLGAIGPKRALITNEEKAASPPYRLVTNDETWLDLTDLVFVDPIGTGYSRSADGVDAKKFYNIKGDIESVGEFIRLYCVKYDRWLSPKFLAGESYGTTRAAGLSGFLQNEVGMYLNGIILISSALDFQVISFTPGNDLSYVLYLPTYTNSAWYHKRLARSFQEDLERTRSEVEGFAINEYLPALAKGNSVPEADRDSIIDRLSAYTGLSKVYIRNHNLRIGRDGFTRELLRDEHIRIGTLDSRIKGDYEFRHFLDDPSVFNVAGALVATWNEYARKELKYESDTVYEFLSTKVNESWNWGSAAEGFPYVADTLDHALAKNGSLRVFMACGYFDLDTPYFGARYVANHFDQDPALLKRVVISYYDAGHQMYTHAPSLKKLKKDIATFFEASLHE